MKNFINYVIATSLASVLATIVGVVLIEKIWVAVLWATSILIIQTVAVVVFGYYEIKSEFGGKLYTSDLAVSK